MNIVTSSNLAFSFNWALRKARKILFFLFAAVSQVETAGILGQQPIYRFFGSLSVVVGPPTTQASHVLWE